MVKPGYARQPANSAADEPSQSILQSANVRQISIFKCHNKIACVGSNSSVTRAAAAEEECKEGFGGVAYWAKVFGEQNRGCPSWALGLTPRHEFVLHARIFM